MKIVIHVGLHRAASTALQRWLAGRRADWQAQGCLVHAGLSTAQAGSPFGVLIGKHLEEMGPRNAALFILEGLKPLAGHARALMVSDENLLGPMPGSGAPPFAALPLLREALERLGRVHEVRPLLVLREHTGWIRSLYQTQQLRGETRSLAEFAAALPVDAVRFAPLAERLGHPLLASLERLASDGGAALQQRLTAELGLAPDPLQRLPVANPAGSAALRRLTVTLGRRRAMLAKLGADGVADLLQRVQRGEAGVDELAGTLHARAVRVAWAQSPARRLMRANVLFNQGIPPNQRLPPAQCRRVAAEWLATMTANMPEELLDQAPFAGDRALIAERYLPEWRTPAP